VPAVEVRKTVTVLWCDLVADDRPDPEALRLTTARFGERSAAIVKQHGGTLEKPPGAEVVAIFGVPAVHEDDALRAARTAIGLRDALTALDAGLRVRIGLATGEVLAGGSDSLVTGEPVAAARQLAHAAGPGQILLGEPTHALVAHAVSASAPEPLRLDGGRGAATVARLDSVHVEATAFPRRDDTALVGRDRELELLRAAFAEVSGGAGARQVTIVGEAGIGKSRLVRELLAEVAGESTILIGRCPPYGEGITFWPLHELLRQTGLDEHVLEGPTHEVFASVRRFLGELAGERPVVATFDDVHWAEATFLDLIEDLAARLGSARVLLLCLARPELAEARPAWLHAPARTIVLEPLSRDDAEALVFALGAPVAVCARIAEAAEGNPLFAEQLAAITDEHQIGDTMPSSIRSVLHQRLDRLEPEHRALLERAAVAGRSFTLDAVIELTPEPERERVQPGVFALVRTKLVHPDAAAAEGYRFHHALIRDTAYDGIPKRVRADLHERVAAWLESHDGDDAVVGFHLAEAFLYRRELGNEDRDLASRAGGRLAAAGRDAYERADASASISLLERALALLPPGDRGRARLLTQLARARIGAGDLVAAEADLERAIEAARRVGDRATELLAVIERQFARSLRGLGAPGGNARVARELIPELEELGDELVLSRAWVLKADGDNSAGRWSEYSEALEHALAHARRGNAPEHVVRRLAASRAQSLLYGPTPVAEAITRIEELLLEAGSDGSAKAWFYASLAGLLAMQGEFEEARRLSEETIATLEALGQLRNQAEHAYVSANIELLAGDAVAAERHFRTARETLGRFGAPSATMGAMLADVLCTLGRLDEAEALAREALERQTEGHLARRVCSRTALARVLVRRGSLEEAERHARQALALTEAIEFPGLQIAALAAGAEVAEAQGRAADTRRLLEEACDLADAKGNIVMLERLQAALAQPVS
jgi:class 3 adenylate cyclase/tetratricopeptide (TPR) repeat protein